jgi:hypothetical protein
VESIGFSSSRKIKRTKLELAQTLLAQNSESITMMPALRQPLIRVGKVGLCYLAVIPFKGSTG